MKLIQYQVYNGWRYIGAYQRKCDKCKQVRKICYEFIREDTPYGIKWNGYTHPEEPLMLGSECVKQFINKEWIPSHQV